MSKPDAALARAQVIRAREIVARQRMLIEQIQEKNGICQQAEDLLKTLEATLELFELDLARIEIREVEAGRSH